VIHYTKRHEYFIYTRSYFYLIPNSVNSSSIYDITVLLLINCNTVCFFEVIRFIIFQSFKITVITPGEALAATIHNELLLAAPNLLLFELFSCLARKFQLSAFVSTADTCQVFEFKIKIYL